MSGPDLDLQHFDSPALKMSFAEVPWDSEAFQAPVAQIFGLEVARLADAPGDFRRFEAWRDEARVALVTCRLDHERLRESMFLEARGFRFVEMVCSPRLERLQTACVPADCAELVEASEADLPALESIAASAFVTGRYHLDWRLPPTLSALRYRRWVRTSLNNPRHTVLVGMVADEVAGFFVVERVAPKRCYWHLTAVAPRWQGKGIGKRLWLAGIRRHQAEGVERIDTTISLHNTPVLNLYARLGFAFAPPQMTFHWLRADPISGPRGEE